MSRIKPNPNMRTITLREGTKVQAQWWADSDRPTVSGWFAPAEQVPYGRCRVNGLVLVNLATLREQCNCVASHADQASHDLEEAS